MLSVTSELLQQSNERHLFCKLEESIFLKYVNLLEQEFGTVKQVMITRFNFTYTADTKRFKSVLFVTAQKS